MGLAKAFKIGPGWIGSEGGNVFSEESSGPGFRADRRAFLGLIAAGTACRGALAADDPSKALIVRNSRPLDAETPVELFDRWKTPSEVMFVRSHFGPPAVGLAPWTLKIEGQVEKAANLSMADLKGLETVTLPALIQCAGNGRALHRPIVPGVPWERGAVANAEWTGVRLADLLRMAGLRPKAKHVHLLAADGPPNPLTPAYLRSIPIARALDRDTLVAWEMNGEPLPVLHGGPLRLIVPGWAANHWIKWLRGLLLAEDEADGFYMRTAYKIPRVPGPPGVDPKPGDLVSVTNLNVKSLIRSPARGSRLQAGRIAVEGVAWTGPGKVVRVEVSINGDNWREARFEGPDSPFAWRLWTFDWDARPGKHVIAVRATDSAGEVQPEATPWNKSGYLWNGIDRVDCEVV